LSVRAVLLFAFGIACIRIAGRRTFAHYSPLDIIVALIVGSNISRVMTGKGCLLPSACRDTCSRHPSPRAGHGDLALGLALLAGQGAAGSHRYRWISGSPRVATREYQR
jgi:hypothetical protein